MQPDQLVAELLGRGDMNDETTLELNRMLEDWHAGRLDPDDETYLRALHGRLMDLSPEATLAAEQAPAPAAASRIEGLTVEEWRERALRAEAELAELRDAAQNG